MKRFALLLIAAMPAAPCSAQTLPAPAPSESPAATAEARHLADLFVPHERILSLVDVMFAAELKAQINRDRRTREAFERDPDLFNALWVGVRPEVLRIIDVELPEYNEAIAALIAQLFDSAEIRQLTGFLSSPTGHKFWNAILDAAAANMDDKTPSNAMMAKVVGAMTPSELDEIERFGKMSAARKFPAFNAGLGPVGKSWSDKVLSAHREEITRIVRGAIKDYMDGKRNRT